jgi:hypothetical protein
LTTLKLNDRLVINGDRYIINEMTTNATTQLVDFELLNDIYNQESDIIIDQETPTNPTEPTRPTVTGKSFSISSTGSSIPGTACALTPNTTKYWNGTESKPTLGDTIYTNIGLTTTFNGGNNYYKIIDSYIIKITASGVVTDLYFCSSGGGGGSA